jgi:hypothetical protein
MIVWPTERGSRGCRWKGEPQTPNPVRPAGIPADGRLHDCRLEPGLHLVNISRQILDRPFSAHSGRYVAHGRRCIWLSLVRVGFCIHRPFFWPFRTGGMRDIRNFAASNVLQFDTDLVRREPFLQVLEIVGICFGVRAARACIRALLRGTSDGEKVGCGLSSTRRTRASVDPTDSPASRLKELRADCDTESHRGWHDHLQRTRRFFLSHSRLSLPSPCEADGN